MSTTLTNAESSHINFYFDPISPYAWLASTRLDFIREQTGLEIIARPILFAGLLKAHGNLGPAEIPAKRNYIFRDVLRRAASLGLHAECPPQHPFNPLLALRVCTAFGNNTQRLQLGCALCDAAWRDGLDITQVDNVRAVLAECGMDADWALEMAQDAAVKQALIVATAAAADSGIFGVPTFQLNGQIFWGEDRVDDLIRFASGQRIDEDKLATVLARGAAAQRKR